MAETTVVAPAMASNDTGSDKGIPFQSPAPPVAKAIQADTGSASTGRPGFRVLDGDYVGIVRSGFETVNSATDPRLCAAIVDRLTFGGTIIETGTDSYHLASTRARTEAPAEAD